MQLRGKRFCRLMLREMGWDSEKSYRIPGRLYQRQNLVLYDLDQAERLHTKNKESIMKVSYLGLRELLVNRYIDANEMIYDCQLPKNVLHDINTSTQTYPLYVRRICRYLECEEKDIISEYSEETRAGVFMPWCYDSVKMLRRHLFYYLHDNDISLDKAVSRTGILKSRLEYFLSYGNLTDLETANLKKLGPAMEKHVIEYLDAMADIRDPDKGDVFESPPMLPLKE